MLKHIIIKLTLVAHREEFSFPLSDHNAGPTPVGLFAVLIPGPPNVSKKLRSFIMKEEDEEKHDEWLQHLDILTRSFYF